MREKPDRHQRLVIGNDDADHGVAASGKLALTRKPPSGRSPIVSSPPYAATRSHPGQAVSRGRLNGAVGQSRAVVGDPDLDLGRPERHVDGRTRGTGVLEAVGEGLLHDPVGGQADPGGHHERRPVHRHGGGQAGLPDPGHQGAPVVQGGYRRARGPVTLGLAIAEDAAEVAHLGHRPASGVLDLGHGSPRPTGVGGVQEPPRGARLHDHDAHRVADDVVQLPGDPQSLLGGGEGGPLPLGIGSLALERNPLLRRPQVGLGTLPAGTGGGGEQNNAGERCTADHRAFATQVDRVEHRRQAQREDHERDRPSGVAGAAPGDRRVCRDEGPDRGHPDGPLDQDQPEHAGQGHRQDRQWNLRRRAMAPTDSTVRATVSAFESRLAATDSEPLRLTVRVTVRQTTASSTSNAAWRPDSAGTAPAGPWAVRRR